MGAWLLRGRYFSAQDGPHSRLVASIDESMARRYGPGELAIGKRFKGQDARGQNDDWLTVVGIVTDMRRSGLDKQPVPHVYEPTTQAMMDTGLRTLLSGGAGSAGAWRGHCEQWFAKSIGALSFLLSSVTTLETERSDQLSPRRFQSESSSVGKTQSQSPCHDPLLDHVNLCGRGSKQLQGKRRTIRKGFEGQKKKKKSGKLSMDLVKLAKIAISPALGKGLLAEFEVALTNP